MARVRVYGPGSSGTYNSALLRYISSPGTDNNTDLGIRSLSGLRLQFDFGLPGILCSIIPNHFLRATLQLCVNSQGP